MDEKLIKQLDELREKLKGEVIAANKAEIEKQITALETKLDNTQLKADLKTIQDSQEELSTELKEVSASVKAIRDTKKTEKTETFASVFEKAVTEQTDNILKMARGDKSVKSFSVDLDMKAVGDMSTSNVTGGVVYGSIYKPGIIERPKRKVHMRQIVNTGTIGPGTDYYFMRENGAGEGLIAPVAEGNAKPQIDFDLVEASVKIETIAGFVRISKKAMNNIPGMLSFLNSRLPEKLMVAEDLQVLYGTGSTPQIKGWFVSGNYTASTSTADVLAEQIIDDLAALEDTYERSASAILLRPIDYYGFFKNKASTSGLYDLPKNVQFVNGVLYISGVPAIPTTALTSGDYAVVDLEGADLLFQEAMRIEFSYEDASNFTTNKVTVRIEENVAFPVYGSDYAIKGTVASNS